MIGYIILLLGGLQGILLSIIIFSKRSKQPANSYLAAFVSLLGLGGLLDNNFIPLDPDVFVIIWSGNSFLFAPFLYLYVRRLFDPFRLNLRILGVHFSVFVLMKIIVVGFHFSDLGNATWSATVGAILNLFLAFFNVGYGLIIMKGLMSGKKSLSTYELRLAKGITLFFVGYTCLLLLRRILTELFSLELLFVDDYLYVVTAVIIYWMSYKIINEPNLLLLKQKKYAKSGLTSSDIERHGQEIERLLSSDRSFIRSDFNLDSLSKTLNIPKHQLSQIISEYFGQSFYDLINELRIKEVIELLSSGEHQHLSILGIAMECGFQSKSSFNKAFRKITGKTPSDYLKSI